MNPLLVPCPRVTFAFDLVISRLVTTGSVFAWGSHISFHFSLSVTSRSRTDSPLLAFFCYLTNEVSVSIIVFCHPVATGTVILYGQDTHPNFHRALETKPTPTESSRGNPPQSTGSSATIRSSTRPMLNINAKQKFTGVNLLLTRDTTSEHSIW